MCMAYLNNTDIHAWRILFPAEHLRLIKSLIDFKQRIYIYIVRALLVYIAPGADKAIHTHTRIIMPISVCDRS